MKIKDRIADSLLYIFFSIIVIVFLLFLLLYLLINLFIMPYDYMRYKRSRYQQDFPHKYEWLSGPHTDNAPYSAIKENNLPIEYIKFPEDYDLAGYFIYKDFLLDFNEPFFYDKKRRLWLFWPGPKDAEIALDDEERLEDIDSDNTDDCLTVEDTTSYILDTFYNTVPGRKCNRVIFFYNRQNAEKFYGTGAAERMNNLDCFVVYEKGQLPSAIKAFIENA